MSKVAQSAKLNGTKVLVLGGDGYCGWPSALRFSALGCDVTIIDNGSRRKLDQELGISSLVPLESLQNRTAAWERISGSKIDTIALDLATDYPALTEALAQIKPDAIVHFAEQRSAPFSMQTREGARYTVDNNVRTTHNLLAAIVETGLDPHVIHLGTIGVYGYSSANLMLPEGYAKASIEGSDGRRVEREILYPGLPDSVYHMTKVLDQEILAFYARHYGVRVTDLHQGTVWATQSTETLRDPALANRFDHDPVYGTVVNRFLVQSSEGRPLTVYGSGEQRRAFIHIEDMLACLTMALETPVTPRGSRVRVINQFGEMSTINALADKISALTNAEVKHIDNPRREPEGNSLEADRHTLSGLGLKPRTFADALPEEISLLAQLRK